MSDLTDVLHHSCIPCFPDLIFLTAARPNLFIPFVSFSSEADRLEQRFDPPQRQHGEQGIGPREQAGGQGRGHGRRPRDLGGLRRPRESPVRRARGGGRAGGENAVAQGGVARGQRVQLLLHAPGILPPELLPQADARQQENHGGCEKGE